MAPFEESTVTLNKQKETLDIERETHAHFSLTYISLSGPVRKVYCRRSVRRYHQNVCRKVCVYEVPGAKAPDQGAEWITQRTKNKKLL